MARQRWVGAEPSHWNPMGVACVIAAMLQLMAPATAEAWWGKLEKLSGPGPFTGTLLEFRVVCFGDRPSADLDELTKAAVKATPGVGSKEARDSEAWKDAADAWEIAARAWARELGDEYEPPDVKKLNNGNQDSQQLAEDLRAMVNRAPATMMATSSAGVLWSLCQPDKLRRLALDVGWNTLKADGQAQYADGAPIHLNTLMASVSWRALAGTRWDFVEASAGAGAYWFTSDGFSTLRGVVLQPGRLTIRAPSSWSGKRVNDPRRWLAIPVYGIGITMFPAGFDASSFAAVGPGAQRISAELIKTQYFFLNLEPFLRRGRK